MVRHALVSGCGLLAAILPVVACRDDGSFAVPEVPAVERRTPAREIDAGADGALPADAGVPPNAVRVAVVGEDIAGIPVVFGDAAGNYLEELRTGPDGTATSFAAGIATVTAGDLVGRTYELTTWMNVKLGDLLAMRSPRRRHPFGTLSLEVSHLPVDSGDNLSAQAGACGAIPRQGVVNIPLQPFCTETGPSGILVIRSPTAGELTYTFTKNGPTWPTHGETVSTEVPSTFLESAKMDVTVAGFNPLTTGSARACLAAVFGTNVYGFACARPTGGATPINYPDAFSASVEASYRVYESLTIQLVEKRVPAGVAVTLDAADLLPRVQFVRGGLVEAGDPRRPSVVWSGDTRGTDGGVVVVTVIADGVGPFHPWTVIVPPGTNELRLPDVRRTFLPAATQLDVSSAMQPAITFHEGDMFPDADAFRQREELYFAGEPWFSRNRVSALAEGERLRTTSYFFWAAH